MDYMDLMLIEKGKGTNDSNVKLMNEDGEIIADERRLRTCLRSCGMIFFVWNEM